MPYPVILAFVAIVLLFIAISNARLREKLAAALKAAVPAFKRMGACLILILMLPGLAAPASANSIDSVEIRAVIHSDGSAAVEEVWDIYITDDTKTEWYAAKHNLDNMDILGLSVQEHKDDSIVRFETLGVWDENASRVEKAEKCGLLKANGGYEICWGFGELGHHKYTVTYTITNVVKGYQGGDAMSFNFLSNASGGADSLNIFLSSDSLSFEYPATRIWVFGYSATTDFADGGITVLGNKRFLESDYAAILLAFDPGLVFPADRRMETLDEIINRETGIRETPLSSFLKGSFIIILVLCVLILHLSLTREKRKRSGMLRKAPYCRELPFEGSIGATYVRLCDIYMINGGNIFGCFLLKWLQAGQADIAANTGYGEAAIRLRAPKPDLPLHEASLYDMFAAAAGPDMILRSKDLKKWAYKNYHEMNRWLLEYRKFYKEELTRMGVYEAVPFKRRFKKSEETAFCDTPLAQDMTLRAFGFKRYLEDFTRVDEREAGEGGLPAAGGADWPFHSVDEKEAREVWDQYLIFAQLFGIADRVAAQLKELDPNSSYQNDLRYIGGSLYFASIATSKSFSQSLQQVFIGSFSGIGAGGFSGGGGAGLR